VGVRKRAQRKDWGGVALNSAEREIVSISCWNILLFCRRRRLESRKGVITRDL